MLSTLIRDDGRSINNSNKRILCNREQDVSFTAFHELRSIKVNPHIKKIVVSAFSLMVGAILLSSSALVKAAGGDLDTSFDPGTGADGAVHATVIQDGKIIIGGGF